MFGKHSIHRRKILQAGSVGLMGLTLPQFLRARTSVASAAVDGTATFGRAKSCILLFMWGGPAHQDTWDLKPDAPSEVRGEFSPIATRTSGIQIGEHFPLLAQQTDRLAIIRSMTHPNVDHLTSTHFLLTGQPPPPSGNLDDDWPNLGSVLARLGRGAGPLPPFVSMRPKLENDVPRFVEQSHGQFAGWLGETYNPLTIDADPSRPDFSVGDFELQPDVTTGRLNEREALLRALETKVSTTGDGAASVMGEHYQRAFQLLNDAVAADAFDLSRESDEMRDRYGRNPHGQSVLLARRLIERGVPLVTAFWPNDGIKNVSVYWDTHSRNFVDLKDRLMPVADRAFTALLDDLDERGLLDETLVIWTGEFGRTPKVGQRNSDAGAGADGRDHWPNCFTTVLAGGGVPGGQVYGASDRHAAYPAADPVKPVDLMATVHNLLGLPPELTLRDAQGRPLVVCPGEMVRPLVG
ncbi:MAG: DUF1501 domain-containing protein [Planctomycetota bacterium]|nr:MAG: DUF1501 domain-containing protein [Planctomycetota bacterium]